MKNKQSFSAINALTSLRSKLNQQALSQSSENHYNELIKSRNSIPRSATKFAHIEEAKAKTVAVDCNSSLNKGITILSSILGGSIKCTSYNGTQKFIDARLEKLGKKNDKSTK